MTLDQAITEMEKSKARYEKLGRSTSNVDKNLEIARNLKQREIKINYRGVHGVVISPEEREFINQYEIIDT